MTTCWRTTPPFSTLLLSKSPAASIVLTTAAFISLLHFDAFLVGQQDGLVTHALGGEIQQDDSVVPAAVSAQSFRSGSQRLPAQVSPDTLWISYVEQSSSTLVMQAGAASALSQLLLLYALVSVATVVDGLQHETFDFGFASRDDGQHELFGFGFVGCSGELQDSFSS